MPRERGEDRGEVAEAGGVSCPCACASGWPLMWAVIAVIFFLDQISKYLALTFLAKADTLPIIKGFFHLTLVMNTGAAFGMLKSQPYVFAGIAVAAIFFINYILVRKKSFLNGVERIALYLILGGTIGNLTDRIRFGYVVDFLDFRVWPVFNVADSFITVGAVMLGLSLLGAFKKFKIKNVKLKI